MADPLDDQVPGQEGQNPAGAQRPPQNPAPPPVVKPLKVSLGQAFVIAPGLEQTGVLRAVLVGGVSVPARGKAGIKAGNRVSIRGDGFSYYNRAALVTERREPVRLERDANKLVTEEQGVSFDFPEIGTVGDKFWILLSGPKDVQPIIVNRALVVTNEKTETEEAEAQKNKSENGEGAAANQDSGSRAGGAGNGLGVAIAEELMGGIARATKEGLQIGLHPQGSNVAQADDEADAKSLDKIRATWKNEYNEPAGEISAEVEDSAEGGIEVTAAAEAAASANLAGQTAVSADVEIGGEAAPVAVSLSSALPSIPTEQREAFQKVAVELSQKTYASVKNSFSTSIIGNSAYAEAKNKILERLTAKGGQALVAKTTDEQLYQAAIQYLKETSPQTLAQYAAASPKVYENAFQDPMVQNMLAEVNRQVENYLGTAAVTPQQRDELRLYLLAEIGNRVWQNFAKEFPDKAARYKNQIPQLNPPAAVPVPPLGSIPVPQTQAPEPSPQPETPPAEQQSPPEPQQVPEAAAPATPPLPPEQPLTPPTPAEQEAARMVAALKKRNQPVDAAAKSFGRKPKKSEANKPGSGTQAPAAPAPEGGAAQGKKPGDETDSEKPPRPDEAAIPSPMQMPQDTQPADQQQGIEQPKAPEQPAGPTTDQLPTQPAGLQPSTPEIPIPAKQRLQKKSANAEDNAETALNALGPAGEQLEKKVMGAAFWWLFGLAWTVIPVFIFDIYWIFFHRRKKKLWPLSAAQKITIVFLNVLLFFCVVGIIAFLAQGCKTLANYNLDQIMGGRLCQIADSFMNGGLSGGITNTISGGTTYGPLSTTQYKQQINAASSILPNACILTTVVAKESAGNPNAVSTTCPSQQSLKGYQIKDPTTGAYLHPAPFYDLDWSCGHAFGLGQIYIYPVTGSSRWQDSNTPSRFLFNHFYTIPELLDPATNLSVAAQLFSLLLSKNSANIPLSPFAQALPPDQQNLWKAWSQYAGAGQAAANYADDSIRRYTVCMTGGS